MRVLTFLSVSVIVILVFALAGAGQAQPAAGWEATATQDACSHLVQPTFVPGADLPWCTDFSVCGQGLGVSCMTEQRARQFFPWWFPAVTPGVEAYPGPVEPAPTFDAYPGLFATAEPGTEIGSAFWTPVASPEALFDGQPASTPERWEIVTRSGRERRYGRP